MATASLTTETDVPSWILIQARYSRCQHGAGEVFADTQLDEAFWRLRSSPSSTTLLLYYSLPNQPGLVCPAVF